MPNASKLHDKDITVCAWNDYKGKCIAVNTEAIKYKLYRGGIQELGASVLQWKGGQYAV
jgi:hypothetical protein